MLTAKPNQIYGNFSPLANAYTKVRKGYPKEVLNWCRAVILGTNPLVLDLGCGTGISTRQLVDNGFRVVGSDVSESMIHEAKESGGEVEYVVAPAEHLPFTDNYFDGATAFTAFHWFDTPEAVTEIYRVLKIGGAFCVVHRREVEAFSGDYRAIVEKAVGKKLPTVYENFNPEQILNQSQFKNIQAKQLYVQEVRPLENYVNYFESTSLWNYVPEALKPVVKQEIHEHFAKLFPDGQVTRKLAITMVAGFKF